MPAGMRRTNVERPLMIPLEVWNALNEEEKNSLAAASPEAQQRFLGERPNRSSIIGAAIKEGVAERERLGLPSDSSETRWSKLRKKAMSIYA
ncbi:MAG: hypothetical protein QME51_04105, partial [Planctomycetota bacterium]|nr:hypothetical protein [Planctomycetota bacterium]